jgi:hypothetical protein
LDCRSKTFFVRFLAKDRVLDGGAGVTTGALRVWSLGQLATVAVKANLSNLDKPFHASEFRSNAWSYVETAKQFREFY